MRNSEKYQFDVFTIENYKAIVRLAVAERFQFVFFHDCFP